MKPPEECTDMGEIRREIDQLDHQIIGLLGQRFHYVKAASKFKTSQMSVMNGKEKGRFPSREQSMEPFTSKRW